MRLGSRRHLRTPSHPQHNRGRLSPTGWPHAASGARSPAGWPSLSGQACGETERNSKAEFTISCNLMNFRSTIPSYFAILCCLEVSLRDFFGGPVDKTPTLPMQGAQV